MSQVRLFIGDCSEEPDWVFVDQRMPWEQAHAELVKRYEQWTTDDCPSCASWAQQQLPKLRALTPGSEWDDNIEGDDYMIIMDS